MRTLVLQIPNDPKSPAPWALFEAPIAVPVRAGTAPSGAPLGLDLPIDRVWVTVPGTAATVHAVALPADANERRMAAAAAFALEDNLAVDPAQLHFALSAVGEGKRLVAVASHDSMRDWVRRLAALGIKADVLVPDFLAISKGPVTHNGFILMRSPDGGFSIEADLAAMLLDNAGSQIPVSSTSDLLQDAYASLVQDAPVNLLQGGYAPKRDWVAFARPWRRAGALAAGIAAAAIVGTAVEGARLNRQAEAASVRAEAIFRAALPEVKRVVNPRAQMRAYLQGANSAGSGGFLALSGVLVSAAAAVPDAEVTTLRFDGKRSEIAVTFSLPTFEAVERVRSDMIGRGALVQEGGARQDGARILADMTVKQR